MSFNFERPEVAELAAADNPEPDAVPFKPFTLDEVRAVTGIYTSALEAWLKTTLGLKRGDDKTLGLDWMQTFAVYVGRRWLDQGSDGGRAARVVKLVSGLTERGMVLSFRKGLVFPQYSEHAPQMLLPKPKGKIGDELNLRTLYREYRAAVKRVFPDRG